MSPSMPLQDRNGTPKPARLIKVKNVVGIILAAAFLIPFLLTIVLVRGVTERPDAAASGYCSVVNHGHHYIVECARWRIAHFCERWLLVYALILLVTSAVLGVRRKVRVLVSR